MAVINRKKLISHIFGYFYTDRTIEMIYPNEIHNFTSLTNSQRGRDMKRISSLSPDIISKAVFYNPNLAPSTVLYIQPLDKIDLIEGRLAYFLVPRYYHDRRDTGFMKNLTYQRKIFADRSNHVRKRFCEFDRVLYFYVSTSLRTFYLKARLTGISPINTLKHLDYQLEVFPLPFQI